MNSWTPKNNIIKLAIVVASFCAVLYFVGLILVMSEIKRVENLYQGGDSEIFKQEKFLAIKAVVEASPEQIEVLRNFFVHKGDEVEFIEQIEGAARSFSVKFEIESLDVDIESEGSLKENIKVKMKTEGSWRNTLLFMDKLGKMPFISVIEKADLEVNTRGLWSGSLELTVFREK